jgi:hypothetical protein
MKNMIGGTFPLLLTAFSAYVFVTALGSDSEQVVLFSDSTFPRKFVIMSGLIGLVGGLVIFGISLFNKGRSTRSE